LRRYVIMEALHDSGERFPEPACHPGTRTATLEDLGSWSIGTSSDSMLLWLNGSAGVGKSAIAQMFAGQCQEEGRLGASFFFRRGHSKRGTWNGLIPTLAYQLATSISQFLPHLQRAVESDKLIMGRSMTSQFQRLIVEPFRNAGALPDSLVIVLDGLDEYAEHKVQQNILRLFIAAARTNDLPVRVLIASRPEPHIREILTADEARAVCQHSVLSAGQFGGQDIRKYLTDEFSRIHHDYTARGIDLGSVWPPSGTIDHLVSKSSGIFIYAATAIRFIDDEYGHPADKLAAVLHLDPQSTAPLDDLYSGIISAIPHAPPLLRILHTIAHPLLQPPPECDPEEIDMLLTLRPGTSRLVLRGLHSLLWIPSIRTRL
ncbi:hypothetical protein B0H13DRAFT_1539908, partial [Mycena leptocephala]